MRKPLAGKRAFDALGRRDASNGLFSERYLKKLDWPRWARDAYMRGIDSQARNVVLLLPAKVEQIPIELSIKFAKKC